MAGICGCDKRIKKIGYYNDYVRVYIVHKHRNNKIIVHVEFFAFHNNTNGRIRRPRNNVVIININVLFDAEIVRYNAPAIEFVRG